LNREEKLLHGAIDVHVHSGPSVIPRSLDHYEACLQAQEVGMAGLVLKDQFGQTGQVAQILKNHFFKDSSLKVMGGATLNNATGGINPFAADTAIRYGVKIIWFPTLSAKHHIEYHKEKTSFFTQYERKDFPEVPNTILDSNKKVKPEVIEICKQIAEANITMGTGHLSIEEIFILVETARNLGVKKILMQHPEFCINASIEEMVQLADMGVFIEHSYQIRAREKMSGEYLMEMIRAVGPERTVIGSDLGQTITNILPVMGFQMFIKEAIDNGLKDWEIEYMIKENPGKLTD
jgi:Family of unknown function (DUF6282)